MNMISQELKRQVLHPAMHRKILLRAAELIEQGWTRGTAARAADGEQLHRALEVGEDHGHLLALPFKGGLGGEDLLGWRPRYRYRRCPRPGSRSEAPLAQEATPPPRGRPVSGQSSRRSQRHSFCQESGERLDSARGRVSTGDVVRQDGSSW